MNACFSIKFFFLVGLCLFFGAGCAETQTSRIELREKNYAPGNIELAFSIFDQHGNMLEASDLQITHEKKVHLLLVRDDMTGFQHVHPEFIKGLWTVSTSIPDQGLYHLYADIAPIRGKAEVLRVPLDVGGPTRNPQTLKPNEDWSATNETYTVRLKIDEPLVAGKMQRWTFFVTRNDKVASNIMPYLGAFGHVVELGHASPDDFFHVHPITQDPPKDGRVVFEGSFPTTGRYTLFAQFNLPEGVKTFPITIDVETLAQGEEMVRIKH